MVEDTVCRKMMIRDSGGSVVGAVENGSLVLQNRHDRTKFTAYSLSMVMAWMAATAGPLKALPLTAEPDNP